MMPSPAPTITAPRLRSLSGAVDRLSSIPPPPPRSASINSGGIGWPFSIAARKVSCSFARFL
jgi:hypothetical protein